MAMLYVSLLSKKSYMNTHTYTEGTPAELLNYVKHWRLSLSWTSCWCRCPQLCFLSACLRLQSQPLEETLCSKILCVFPTEVTSTLIFVIYLHVCKSLTCLKAWSHIGVNEAPQSASTNSQCVSLSHRLPSPYLQQLCGAYFPYLLTTLSQTKHNYSIGDIGGM